MTLQSPPIVPERGVPLTAETVVVPVTKIAACQGEQVRFEAWAKSQRYDMGEHPLHYIFSDPKTDAARMGWNAALAYVRDAAEPLSAAPAREPEGGAECELCNDTGIWPTADGVGHHCDCPAALTFKETTADHHERNLSMTNDELIEQAMSHPPLEAPAATGAGERETAWFGVTGATDETDALAVALFDARCPGVRMTDEDLHYYRDAAKQAMRAVTDELDTTALAIDFARSHPSGMDDSTYEQIEDALDRADAPINGPDGKFLTLAQRVDALRAEPQAREEVQPVAWGLLHKASGKLWPEVRNTEAGAAMLGDSLDGPGVYSTQPLYTTPPAPEAEKLLNALRDHSWDLRCFDVPTGGDDADIGWRVVGHWQAEPRERTIAEVFSDDPAEAIRQALAALQQDALSAAPGEARE